MSLTSSKSSGKNSSAKSSASGLPRNLARPPAQNSAMQAAANVDEVETVTDVLKADGHESAFSSKPIFNVQAADPFELVGIGGHDRGAGRIGVGGDQQIVAADRFACRLELRADSAVFAIGWHIERQHVDLAEQVFNCFEQSLRAALRASVAQLGRHDDAGADVVIAYLGDPLRGSALRVSD